MPIRAVEVCSRSISARIVGCQFFPLDRSPRWTHNSAILFVVASNPCEAQMRETYGQRRHGTAETGVGDAVNEARGVDAKSKGAVVLH